MYLDYAVLESLDVDTVGSHCYALRLCLRTKTKIALMSSGICTCSGSNFRKGQSTATTAFLCVCVEEQGWCCCYRERCRPATVARSQTQNAACSLCKPSHPFPPILVCSPRDFESGLSRPSSPLRFFSLSLKPPSGLLALLSLPHVSLSACCAGLPREAASRPEC